VVPGGIGTVLETKMVWQLLQVQKLHDTPLIMVGKMYADLVAWCQTHMLRPECPLASSHDLEIPTCVDDGPSILRIIGEHHSRWKERKKRQEQIVRS
jgi:predicted Rossmann-fold nucleotide-binding protein